MKRIFSTLIIGVILIANLFAPFEYSLKEKSFKKSQAQAAFDGSVSGYKNAFKNSILEVNNTTLTANGTVALVDFKIKLDTGLPTGSTRQQVNEIFAHVSSKGSYWIIGDTGTNIFNDNSFVLVIKDKATGIGGYKDITYNLLLVNENNVTTNYIDKKDNMPISLINDVSIPSTLTGDLSYLKPSTTYIATLYYRADSHIGSGDGAGNGESILDILKNKDFYPVGNPIEFTTTDRIGGGGDLGSGQGYTDQAVNDDLPACSLGFLPGVEGDILGCGVQILFYLVYTPVSWGMAAAGMFMDFSLDYSLDSASYSGESTGFVSKAWGFIRDLCNIFFIVSMLYIALGVIFEFKGAGDWKKSVANLVIAALAINFSLFITKIPIDLGNIAARVFYNSDLIKITKVGDDGETTGSLSEAVVEGFQPQRIYYDGLKNVNNVKGENASEGTGVGTYTIIIIFATIINWIALWIFFKIGLLFLGRVVSLWYHMILSPLAFVSDYLPDAIKSSVGGFNFSSWMKEIVRLSVMPVIFMALMYLLLLFISVGTSTISKGGNAFAWIIGTVAPFVFVIIMLKKAQTTTEGFADDIARKTTDYAGKAIGTVAGLAAGGVGFAGRRVLGSKLANLANSSSLKDTAAKGGIGGAMARMTLKGADYGSKASFDLRGTDAFKKAGFDDSYSKGATAKMFGMDLKDGGYVGAEKRRKEMHEKRMKQFAANDDEYKALKAREEKRFGEKFDKEKFENKYGKNANELNINRQTAYAESLKNKGKSIGEAVGKVMGESIGEAVGKAVGKASNAAGAIAGNNTIDEKFADKVLKDGKEKKKKFEKIKDEQKSIENQIAIVEDEISEINTFFEKMTSDEDFKAIRKDIKDKPENKGLSDASIDKKASQEYEAKIKKELRELEAKREAWRTGDSDGDFEEEAKLELLRKESSKFESYSKKNLETLEAKRDKLEKRSTTLSGNSDKISGKDKKDEEKKDDKK